MPASLWSASTAWPAEPQTTRHSSNNSLDTTPISAPSPSACPVAKISTFPATILAAIDQLAVSSVVLVDHSKGCRIALEIWNQAQSAGTPQVQGIVFLDGSDNKLRSGPFVFDTRHPASKTLTDEQKLRAKTAAFRQMFSSHTPETLKMATPAQIRGLDGIYGGAIREDSVRVDFEVLDSVLERYGGESRGLLNLQSSDVDRENRWVSLETGRTSTAGFL
ncbi:hypothetical protein B0A50_07355 [Salinomyces thailandicus]|uniref:Uncharacterized protein n=1 Tax=Salinomyces thailandicus TaxID=706561 RepID=A0A4U0TMT6_9PEZI|nr:hypothetical protein B0A50_07355 [Salinomyces thailandica]